MALVVTYLGMSKAFDQVPCPQDIFKPVSSDIIEHLSNLSSQLTQRSQTVFTNGISSNPGHITSGVIQANARPPFHFAGAKN